MPSVSSGRVSCAYSVIHIGTFLRLNHLLSSALNRGIEPSETFGQRTRWFGRRLGTDGYGWCDQASNLSRGFALATSSANLPGEWVGRMPVALSLPRAEVSPMPTLAIRFPALMPAYA